MKKVIAVLLLIVVLPVVFLGIVTQVLNGAYMAGVSVARGFAGWLR